MFWSVTYNLRTQQILEGIVFFFLGGIRGPLIYTNIGFQSMCIVGYLSDKGYKNEERSICLGSNPLHMFKQPDY